MDPKEVIRSLHARAEYEEWRSQHPDDILAHIFLEPDNIQVGYYDIANNRMTTFVVGDELKIVPDQEILRSEGGIDTLDVDSIGYSAQQALEAADALRKTHYGAERILKSLSILQSVGGTSVYNITYFTQSFKTINIKVNAVDGSIVHHSMGSLAQFDSGN